MGHHCNRVNNLANNRCIHCGVKAGHKCELKMGEEIDLDVKTIAIKDFVNGTTQAGDGNLLYIALHPYFLREEKVNLSFKDTTPMSASFFNASFGRLIDEYNYLTFTGLATPVDIESGHFKLVTMFIDMHKK